MKILKRKNILLSILAFVCCFCLTLSIISLNSKNKAEALTTSSTVVAIGADVSRYDYNIDFATYANTMDFAIPRLSYSCPSVYEHYFSGYSTPNLDPYFEQNMNGFINAGVPVGLYIYSMADSTADAVLEAQWIIEKIEYYGYDQGTFTYPIFFDYEETSVIDSRTKAQNTAIINAFMDYMWDAGYYPALYMGGSRFINYTTPTDLHCDVWVAAYNMTYSNFVSQYGYPDNVTMWQCAGDDYNYNGYYNNIGSNYGVTETTYIDLNWCYVDYPSIIKSGGYNGCSTAKQNSVLGSTPNSKADSSWTVTNDKATLSSYSGENILYFAQSNATDLTVEATFTTTGKASSELWGKFGISFINGSGNGLFYYVDAFGTSGTAISNITGTDLGYVKRDSSLTDLYAWQTTTNGTVANKYSSSQAITLKIERHGVDFKLYANGELIASLWGEDYGIGVDEQIYASIRSFNIGIEVTDFKATAKHNSLTIDGGLSDWQTLSNWNSIQNSAVILTDQNDLNLTATFYTRYTQEGLFIYATANHKNFVTTNDDWSLNTGFTIYYNSADSFAYATDTSLQNFDSFYINTTGEENNYVTVLEGFIAYDGNSTVSTGYLFRENQSSCLQTETATELPITVTREKMRTQDSAYSMLATSGISKAGNNLVFNGFDGERDYYFDEFEGSINNVFSATFNLTGKLSTELYGKIGLSYIDEWGDGFFFYAHTDGTTGTDLSSITGTGFGLVVSKSSQYLWTDSLSVENISHASAIYSKDSPFTMSINRNNTVYELLVNGTVIYTITDSTGFRLLDSQSIYPSIRSFNTYAYITDYGLEKTAIDGILTDSNLDDWKALENWESISENCYSITDTTDSTKGAWFYSKLTNNGLHIAIEVHHDVHSVGYWGTEWYKNTNIEMFIGVGSYNNQFYATNLLHKGWTYHSFVTTGTSGNYITVFEGFIDLDTLINVGAFNGNVLNLGYSFSVNDQDSITVNGTETYCWCAENTDPLLLPCTVSLEQSSSSSTPDTGDDSSSNPPTSSTVSTTQNSSNAQSSTNSISSESSIPASSTVSTTQSSSNAQSSTDSVSSESSIPASSTVSTTQSSSNAQSSTSNSSSIGSTSSIEVQSSSDTTTSEQSSENISSTDSTEVSDSSEKTSKKKGCKGSIYSVIYMLPLAFIALAIMIKKVKN